jgi:membrane protease YdiL (CAAX protease family)
VVISAWLSVLLVSDLPNVLLARFAGIDPTWLPWAKVGVLAVALVFSLVTKAFHPLWGFTFVFLVFFLANNGVDWVRGTEYWQSRFEYDGVAYPTFFLPFHSLDIIRSLLVIAALWFVKRNRADFFLTKGQMDAPIEPVRWLGIKQGESWRVFGWIFTACAAVAIVIPLAYSVPLTAEAFSRALPYLPLAILLAGLNAFAEETYFRASILSTLADPLGKNHALLLACIFFGLGHWLSGSPPGFVGFALTGFLAFLLGKSMLETRGMLWAWIMHFVPDVFIFFSYAMTWD